MLYPDGMVRPSGETWGPVLEWIRETLASSRLADVRKKLAATGAEERHRFLGTTYTCPGVVFFALTRDEQTLPEAAPILPPEITHLWLMNAEADDRCLVSFPNRGWVDAGRRWATY